MGIIEERLAELGIVLPRPRRVPANFIPGTVLGEICWLSGTLGTVVNEVTLEEGYASARQCSINHLSWLKLVIGDLDRVQRILKVNGYVNAVEGYNRGPWVANGASDLLVEVFGPERGRHARAVVCVAGLAFDAPVEIEMTVQIKI
jgi:enamine deaminase RidA (YjgF/YER057c/UK114 family)